MGTISGLGSNLLGFNTEKIVNQLVNNRYGPRIDQLNSEVDQTKTIQSAYQSLNSKVGNLQSSVSALTDPSTFQLKTASSSDSEVLGATVVDSSKAGSGTDQIYVEQMAQAASVKSGQFINNVSVVDSGNTGSDGRAATSLSDFEQVEGGETLDPNTATLEDLSREIQTSGGGMGSGGDPENEIRIDYNNDGNWTEFDLDSYDTIGGLMDAINNHANNQSGGEQLINFSYDSGTDQFKIIPQQPGQSFQVDDIQSSISDSSKGFFQQIGIAENESIHTFDNTQSSINRNLVSIDPSKAFNNNQFSSPLSGDSGTISINNTEISWNTDTSDTSKPSTVNELVQEINDEVTGISATYNSATDKVKLETENTGQGDISVTDQTGNLADVLNLRESGNQSGSQAAQDVTEGQDAILELNGTEIYESSNTFTRGGIEYNVKDLHKVANNSEPITVSTEQDQESITKKVSSFVDSFNKAVEFINNKSSVDISEGTNNSGVFAGEPSVQSIKSQMTTLTTQRYSTATKNGQVQSLADVGIELVDPLTSSDADEGKLQFNESEFKSALQENPQEVRNLFTANEGDTDRGGNQDGMAVQLNDYLKTASGDDGFIASRIDGYSSEIETLNERIESQQERAQDMQSRLEERYLAFSQQAIRLQRQLSRVSSI